MQGESSPENSLNELNMGFIEERSELSESMKSKISNSFEASTIKLDSQGWSFSDDKEDLYDFVNHKRYQVSSKKRSWDIVFLDEDFNELSIKSCNPYSKIKANETLHLINEPVQALPSIQGSVNVQKSVQIDNDGDYEAESSSEANATIMSMLDGFEITTNREKMEQEPSNHTISSQSQKNEAS